MTANKVIPITRARLKRHSDAAMTQPELARWIEQERAALKKNTMPEPDVLVSGGDMSKILEESDDE